MAIDYGSNSLTTISSVTAANVRLSGNGISVLNTNGNLVIQSNGSGALQRTISGNTRGSHATDLQGHRSNNAQVANGVFSFIGGGGNNTASSTYSCVVGGYGNTSSTVGASVAGGKYNTSSGPYSFVGGGSSNFATNVATVCAGGLGNSSSGSYSVVCGGDFNSSSASRSCVLGGGNNASSGSSSTVCGGVFNTASASYSSIGGGSNNLATGNHSCVPGGLSAVASRTGELAHAAGPFSESGDAQHSIFVLRGKTTSGSQTTTLGLDGTTTSRLTVASGFILSGTINIVGSISTGASVARYVRQFTIKNVGGTTSLVGSIITLGTDEAAGTTISITADNTNDALQISVTRAASETWRWVAVVDAVQMKYGS
jgi:hypothetical protein